MDAEKEILRVKAHEKQISTISQSRCLSGNTNSSVDRDGNPIGKPVRTKHNKHQRQMYNNCWRARKAQQKAQTSQNNQNNKNNAPAAMVNAIKTDQ